ncbi:hypothetical protein [Pelagibius sp.]|uniref:hypothetical protein n=1 Tax=Pelagibius sp. TaxID=1931238 RepID=UPI003BAEC899
MSQIDYINEALRSFLRCVQQEGRIAVPTLCLYPSNSTVTVYVTGGEREVVVSDGGGAMHEIAAHGLPATNQAGRILSTHCRSNGLKHDGKRIYSDAIPLAAISSAIALVANASSLAAHDALSKIRVRQRRDLREALKSVLEKRYSKDQIKHEVPIMGESAKQYKFDTVIELGGDRRLIVDTVVPEASSINARIVSHIDVSKRDDPTVMQRIVYDQGEEWSGANLKLLQMAATLVPFEMVGPNLDRLRVS